jgi:hypothetical protein
MRIGSVAKRIDVAVASREHDAVEPVNERLEKLTLRDEREVDRKPAGAVDGLGVGLPEVEVFVAPVVTRRNADERSMRHKNFWPPEPASPKYTAPTRAPPSRRVDVVVIEFGRPAEAAGG